MLCNFLAPMLVFVLSKSHNKVPCFFPSRIVFKSSRFLTVQSSSIIESVSFTNDIELIKYKGDIYLYDSERDSFMMALKALGYSMNTSSEEELNEAYESVDLIIEDLKRLWLVRNKYSRLNYTIQNLLKIK